MGTEDLTKTTFSWASTTIPDELVDHNLTLQLNLRSSNNSPALDELFVTASNNAILMRQLPGNGHYELVLPNKQPLTVQVDPKSDTLKLGYPENTIQIIELNKQYPFIGDWLKQVLPKNQLLTENTCNLTNQPLQLNQRPTRPLRVNGQT
ncbi:hypothetical protein [Lacticaseibacillus saniviri]|uniref:hypothetical protein n=1 Tax=Lacticaseibacillus saniviri TaxID=931533 RepID=UPI000B0EAF10|nr:hypothetical protein [Lacticaseibacillus saniviri]